MSAGRNKNSRSKLRTYQRRKALARRWAIYQAMLVRRQARERKRRMLLAKNPVIEIVLVD